MANLMKISEIDSKFKIAIENNTNRVEAPLHNDFGFTVGSEYTTPFDIGTVSGMLQKSMAVAGVSSPVGLRMRKMYANPEPTELSFKMSFDAYYDAHTEVISPVVTLVTMGLGREMRDTDVTDKLSALSGIIDTVTGTTIDTSSVSPDSGKGVSSKVLGLIKMINAPQVCTLHFGDFLTFDNVYITSTAVTFSNNLDENGIPMSAEVNVTCTLQIAPIADDILRYFKRGE